MTISIPVYKTGQWNEEVEHIECTTKIKKVSIPDGVKVGWDDKILSIDLFGINLN